MKLYIARDKDGSLCLHDEEPHCSENGVWYSPKQLMYLPKNEYLEITFENSPQQVELKPI